jgi:hypothetical protein
VKPGGDVVLRVDRTHNFKSVDLSSMDDRRLSAKAVCYHLFLISRPDGWSFYEADLAIRWTDGKYAVRSGLKELEDCGYLDRSEVLRDPRSGKIIGRRWVIREQPDTVPLLSRQTVQPSDGQPDTNNKEGVAGRSTKTETPLPPAGAGEGEVGDIFPPPQPSRAKPKSGEDDPEFCEAWSLYPRRATDSRTDALKAWRARKKAGATGAEMLAGVRRYAAYITRTGKREYAMGAARFFGPGEYWQNDYGEEPASSADEVDMPAAEPGDRAMTGFDLDMQALVHELFAPHPNRDRIIAIKRRLGCLGEEVGVRGHVFQPFPEELEAREVGV